RTPMNAIMGLTYLLEQGGLEDGQHALVRKIHQAGQALLGIINDILDFSKIESGRLKLERVPFSLEEVLDHVAAIMST
ncbi:sensor histidine kinase, partial [Aeromonas caviae]